MTNQTQPMPEELEERLDDIVDGGAAPPAADDGYVATNPNDTEAEHEEMVVADADHKQEPGQQFAGGQSGG